MGLISNLDYEVAGQNENQQESHGAHVAEQHEPDTQTGIHTTSQAIETRSHYFSNVHVLLTFYFSPSDPPDCVSL